MRKEIDEFNGDKLVLNLDEETGIISASIEYKEGGAVVVTDVTQQNTVNKLLQEWKDMNAAMFIGRVYKNALIELQAQRSILKD